MNARALKVPKEIAGEEVLPKLKAKAAKAARTNAAPKPRTVALDRCYVARENARAGIEPENIPELAANIAAYGLLQPIGGYEDESGNFAVTAGRRRLAALNALRAQGAPEFDWNAIPATEIDQAAAIGASLSENTQRVDLGIVESAVQFSRMEIAGDSIAAIAKAFGQTERFVKGRLKLAGLHEPILEALRAGELSLDVAQIYATAEMARQEKVWKGLKGVARTSLYQVKEELKKNTLLAGDGLARFVGEAAYIAAGGVVEHADLFQTADMNRWLDPALAERLAQEKLKLEAAKLEAEGFLFVEAAIEIPRGKYVDGNFAKGRKATPEEKQRLDEIAARKKEMGAARDAIDARAAKREGVSLEEFYGDYSTEEEAELDALENEDERLDAERERIRAGLVKFDDAAKEKSGVTLTIDDDGGLLITRGVVAPKDRRATPAGKSAAKSGKAASAKPSKPEPQAPMTNATHEKTTRIASAIVGRTLATNPAIALVALTATAARELFFYGGFNDAVKASGFERGEVGEGLLSDKAFETERNRWEVALGKLDEDALEQALSAWPQADVLALLAFCVGNSISYIETNAARDHSDDSCGPRVQLIALAKLAGVIPAAHFVPDAGYLEGFSKSALEAAAAEMGVDIAGVKTKTALAALVADKAALSTWTPPLLRTLCGVSSGVSDVSRTAANKKSSASAKPPARSAAKADAGAGAAAVTAKAAAPKSAKKPKVKKVAKKAPAKGARA